MAQLPLLKLAGLFVKTIAKPLATRMTVEARTHPRFSATCIQIGQLSHQIISRMNVLASGYKILGVSPLPEGEALAQGITVVSESLVFLVAGSIIVVEYARNEAKNSVKAQQLAKAESEFRNYLDEKFFSLNSEIRSLNDRLEHLESAVQQQEKEINKMKEIPNPTSKPGNTSSSSSSSSSLQRWFSWQE